MSINQPSETTPLADGTDCHMHVYDQRYPAAPGATLLPADAALTGYLPLRAALGLERTVVVQPSTYGTDNRCTLAACHALGAQARAVVAIAADSPDGALLAMREAGARGIRFGLAPSSGHTPESVTAFARRAADAGMHLQLTLSARRIAAMQPLLQALPCPLVVDHMGNIPPAEGADHPAWTALRSLLDAGRTWIKLSGAYLFLDQAGQTRELAQALTRQFIVAAPQRMLWGSNWPHPTHARDHAPDDRSLLALMCSAAADAATVRRILVDNPAEVYGFAPAKDHPLSGTTDARES
jgi:predicted TIM-barrel fold metal-dependent hydrolase